MKVAKRFRRECFKCEKMFQPTGKYVRTCDECIKKAMKDRKRK